MSQVNLLPPELRQRQVLRRNTTLVGLVGVGLLALIGAFYFLQTMNLGSAQDELEAQQSANASLSSDIAELQRFEQLQQELATKGKLIDTVLANEVSWSGVLLDVSQAIPTNAYLTSMSGQMTVTTGGPGGAPAPGVPTDLIGSISFAGQAQEADTVAAWLTRLEQVKGWVNAWLTSATESEPFSRIYTFSSGVDLSIDSVTQRGKAALP